MTDKKRQVTRVSTVYSKTKESLDKYYKQEFSTTKATRVVVWEQDGYNLMVDEARSKPE